MAQRGLGYEDVADDLREAITSGTYAPRSRLPHQRDLAGRYGVAVLTIRRAVDQLVREGHLQTIRGHGTFVRNPNPLRLPLTRHAQLATALGPFETAAAAQGLTGVTETLGVDLAPTDAIVAQELGVQKGALVVHRTVRMRVDSQVLQIQHTYLPRDVADGTPLAEPAKLVGGTYAALRATGIELAGAVEVVTGRMPSKAEATTLGLPPGSPVLEVRRTTRTSDGQRVVHTKTVVNADHANLVYHQEL
jgi:GntR family transcriptional regulator